MLLVHGARWSFRVPQYTYTLVSEFFYFHVLKLLYIELQFTTMFSTLHFDILDSYNSEVETLFRTSQLNH
jgi:hypothetical protein